MFQSQDYNSSSFKVATNEKDFRLVQDVEAYREYASQQRELDSNAPSARQYRSFAILPDIVCIDILTKYGLDIHAPDFMGNPANLTKLKKIIDSDYPLLKTSNIKAL
jgi:hypothetical protein